MGHVCWPFRGTTSHQSVGQGGFPDAPSAQQHDPGAAGHDGCMRRQVSVVDQDGIVVGLLQLQGEVGVTFPKVHTNQSHKGPWVRSQDPDQCGIALITDAVPVQAAMYTPTHNSQYLMITKPTTREVHTTQTMHTSPHTPTHSCQQTYTSVAHSKHVFSPLPHTHSNTYHVPRTALHCTYQTLAPTSHPPTKKTPAAHPSHHHSLTPHSPPPHSSLPHPLRTPAASAMAHVAAPPRSLHHPHHRCDCSTGCHVHTHARQPVLIHHQTHHTTWTYNAHNLHLTTHSCLQADTSLPMPNKSLAPCHTRIQNIPRASHCTALYLPNTHSHVTSAHQQTPAAQPSHHHTLTPHSPPPHGSLPRPLRTSAASMMAHVAAPPRSLHSSSDRCCYHPGCRIHTHAQQPALIHHQTHHTRDVHTTQTIDTSPHTPTLPHTHARKPTLLCPCHTCPSPLATDAFQNIPRASHSPALHCIVPTKHSQPRHIRPPKHTCGPALP
jgi:hypothetical protein